VLTSTPSVTAVSSSSISIQWGAAESHGSPITEYRVLFGRAEHDLNVAYTGDQLKASIKALSPATNYFFKIQVAAIGSYSPILPYLGVQQDRKLDKPSVRGQYQSSGAFIAKGRDS
jgi:chitodextrinase